MRWWPRPHLWVRCVWVDLSPRAGGGQVARLQRLRCLSVTRPVVRDGWRAQQGSTSAGSRSWGCYSGRMRTADTEHAEHDRTYILGMMERERRGEQITERVTSGETLDEFKANLAAELDIAPR